MENAIAQMDGVQKVTVSFLAQKLTLDTVYFLKGKE